MKKEDLNGFIFDNIQFLNVSIQEIESNKLMINNLIQRKKAGEIIDNTEFTKCLEDMRIENNKINDILSLTSFYLTQISYSEEDFL